MTYIETPDDVPQEWVDVFVEAWEKKRKEIGRGIAAPGTKVRAGLFAVFLEATE